MSPSEYAEKWASDNKLCIHNISVKDNTGIEELKNELFK